MTDDTSRYGPCRCRVCRSFRIIEANELDPTVPTAELIVSLLWVRISQEAKAVNIGPPLGTCMVCTKVRRDCVCKTAVLPGEQKNWHGGAI